MRKKVYEKPSLEVVELKHNTMLLQTSANMEVTVDGFAGGGTLSEDGTEW